MQTQSDCVTHEDLAHYKVRQLYQEIKSSAWYKQEASLNGC